MRYSINITILINSLWSCRPVGGAEHMIQKCTGHAVATRLLDAVVMQRMPAFAPFQPSIVEVPMVNGVVCNRVRQISCQHAERQRAGTPQTNHQQRRKED